MNILAIVKDDETLSGVLPVLKKVFPGECCMTGFINPIVFVKHLYNNKPDIVFITSEIAIMRCLNLVEILQKRYPQVKTVFIINNMGEWEFIKNRCDNISIPYPITEDAVRQIMPRFYPNSENERI